MNILYIGSSGVLSLLPFKKLLALETAHSQYTIVAAGVYQPAVLQHKIIVLQNESLALAAQKAGIPVIDLSRSDDEIINLCSTLSVDLIIMSCYSKRLPEAIIHLAGKGCYNLHPSLLPAYRGPEPVFWQMQQAAELGVSWHRVIQAFDAGDIVAQKKVFAEDGFTYQQISFLLAQAGAELLPELVNRLVEDTLQPVRQDNHLASYYSFPQPSDFSLNTAYDARHNYNFMCATRAFSVLYPYHYRQQHRDGLLYLIKALDYDNNQTLDSPEVQASRIYIPCNGGVLIATYTDKITA